MRIPKDIPLAVYIKRLIAAGEEERFYWTDDWKELRADVLEFFHNECQECLKHGKITTDELCVHHVNELKNRPDLALSRHYVDSKGQRQYNLIPLCKTCHNIVHDKLGNWQRKDKFTNTELW